MTFPLYVTLLLVVFIVAVAVVVEIETGPPLKEFEPDLAALKTPTLFCPALALIGKGILTVIAPFVLFVARLFIFIDTVTIFPILVYVPVLDPIEEYPPPEAVTDPLYGAPKTLLEVNKLAKVLVPKTPPEVLVTIPAVLSPEAVTVPVNVGEAVGAAPKFVKAAAAVVAFVPPFSIAKIPPKVSVPEVVIGPPFKVKPVVPPLPLTLVTPPPAGPCGPVGPGTPVFVKTPPERDNPVPAVITVPFAASISEARPRDFTKDPAVTLPLKFKLVPVAAPIAGETKVGEVENTTDPVPVSSDNAVAKFALVVIALCLPLNVFQSAELKYPLALVVAAGILKAPVVLL